MDMKKVIRDGMVAIAYSPGFGAGWYTWHNKLELLFHPAVIDVIENDNTSIISPEWIKEKTGIDDEYICLLGARNLKIQWLPEGTAFHVEEYDGAEDVISLDKITIVA